MMYAKGNEFIKDFAERTQANLSRLEKGPYEVTQLINSMIGLLIIPKEMQYKQIVDQLIEEELLEKVKNCITLDTYGQSVDLRQLCRHFRNAVAHSRMDFEAEKPSETSGPLIIHSVTFTDIDTKDPNKKMIIKIPIALLRDFLVAFSTAIIKLT